jgi:hypothetical protein
MASLPLSPEGLALELLLLHAWSATPKRPATVAIETDERMASIEVSLSRARKRTQANERSRYEGARARFHGAATICFFWRQRARHARVMRQPSGARTFEEAAGAVMAAGKRRW